MTVFVVLQLMLDSIEHPDSVCSVVWHCVVLV